MKPGKISLYLLLYAPAIVLVSFYLYVNYGYSNDIVVKGQKYGFTVGETKDNSFQNLISFRNNYPDLEINLYFGNEPEDCIQIPSKSIKFEEASKYEKWELLLNGDEKRTNTVKLNFENDKLVTIHRREKYDFF